MIFKLIKQNNSLGIEVKSTEPVNTGSGNALVPPVITP